MDAVKLADLKARLSAHVRRVRKGRPLTVFDRDTPVARLVPIESGAGTLEVRRATRQPRDLPAPPRRATPTDSAAMLRADRNRR